MRKYITDYIKEIEGKVNSNYKFTKEEISIFKEKIVYFQHERLIHLLVTLFYALFAILFMALIMLSHLFIIIFIFLIVFLLFYVRHYFFLENQVQYMYTLYDKIISRK